MHWQRFKLRLAIIPIIVTMFILVGCQIETSSVSIERAGAEEARTERQNQYRSKFPPESNDADLSCADPAPGIREQCQQYEQQILATVVRLEVLIPSLDDPDLLTGGSGYGTIKDGRFIVVHNHFLIDLSIFADEAQRDLVSLNLYSASGYMLLRNERPPLFEIVVEDQETLVLDFGTNDEGEGFFDWFRVPSAPFKNIQEIKFQPGSEVAQVNWDGKITYIDWVQVQEVITNDGVPRLVLANPINDGSSGGGVFWKGAHIANNWMKVGILDAGGTVTFQYSIAAINSMTVAPNQLSETRNLNRTIIDLFSVLKSKFDALLV